jgi:uncharacterized protein
MTRMLASAAVEGAEMKLGLKASVVALALALTQGSAPAAGAAAKASAPPGVAATAAPHAPDAPRDAPAAPSATPSAAPGFPCTGNLSPVEELICGSVELSGLDRAMAEAYSASVEGLVGPLRSRAVDAQRRWLALRNSCPDEACLIRAYQSRMASLGTGSPRETIRPSFRCGVSLGEAEAAICADGKLAELDLRLSAAYSVLAGSLDAGSRQRLAATQRRWITRRDGCGADAACLTAAYTERLAAISGWSEAAQE